ncbi:phytoene/squalene synthase family protein [Roseibium sp. RKSG952]|uniref:phytoene/squalene synthase family protein n=1 Tax=Roseibium sp. RKSG952 TaxID=2529384 RepID=UPI0012BB6B4F|nr:phytoene/squalene synthase family protein [Roseibium sp. RKSG952]MTH97264.1 squalene/phytoene synthase family protein [Roseibium sp. RKSG952]
MTSNYDHAAESVRVHDWDRYLSVLFAHERHRPGLFALYAFNAEIARVRDQISNPMPGEIRLQWWRDLIEGQAHGDAGGNPMAAAFMETVTKYDLPRHSLTALIDARVFDLYDDPMPSLNDLEGYAGETASAIFQLAGLILNDGADPKSAEAAGHAGVVYAIAGLMRGLPQHAARRQMYLPADVLARHNVDAEKVFAGETTPELRGALGEMAGHARHHLKRVGQFAKDLPVALAPAYLPLALTERYLGKLEKVDRDPIKEPVEISRLRRQWTVWRASRKPFSGF